MKLSNITIIGAGNMGHSLISGLISDGHPSDKICATDLNDEKLSALQNQFHIHIEKNNEAAIQQADVVIFAIKPQSFAETAKEVAQAIQLRKPLVISIAAGI